MQKLNRPSRYLLLGLVASAIALLAGIHQGLSNHAYASDTKCTTSYTESCQFYECTGSSGWTANDYAVEYDVLAAPWHYLANGGSRVRRLSWKDTASGALANTSWPPMTVQAAWNDDSGGYHYETLYVYEDGTTSGSSNIRVWTRNGSTSNLCDNYAGRSWKQMNGSCIGMVFYGIDVRDDYDNSGHCLAQVQVTPAATNYLKAQDPAQCPDGTNLTYVGGDTLTLECNTTFNIVIWNYE